MNSHNNKTATSPIEIQPMKTYAGLTGVARSEARPCVLARGLRQKAGPMQIR